MAKKFNPSPPDKHAADAKQAIEADKRMQNSELDKGLEETFPASDPVSITQPRASTSDDPNSGQGIMIDQKGQEQPTDKERARLVSRKNKDGDPPGQRDVSQPVEGGREKAHKQDETEK
jgi:hypothetical protein